MSDKLPGRSRSVVGLDDIVSDIVNQKMAEIVAALSTYAYTDGDVPGGQETLTAAAPVVSTTGVSILDSTSNAVDGTLASGILGLQKLIVMSEASNSSTITIAAHETSDPEVLTFNAIDEYWLGQWTGTEWATISMTSTAV